jgi:hypothetical protein
MGRLGMNWLIKPEPKKGLKLMKEKEEESPTSDRNSYATHSTLKPVPTLPR